MKRPKKVAHRLTEHTKLIQKAVLVSGEKALLLKRSADSKTRPECWDLPGGNAEWPEITDNQAGLHAQELVREIEEETGIAVDAQVFARSTPILFDTYFEADKQVYAVITNWLVELPDSFPEDQLVLSDEHTEYAWTSLEELKNFDFGGERGNFIVESVETALAFAQAAAGKAGGCCGGACGGVGGGCHH